MLSLPAEVSADSSSSIRLEGYCIEVVLHGVDASNRENVDRRTLRRPQRQLRPPLTLSQYRRVQQWLGTDEIDLA